MYHRLFSVSRGHSEHLAAPRPLPRQPQNYLRTQIGLAQAMFLSAWITRT